MSKEDEFDPNGVDSPEVAGGQSRDSVTGQREVVYRSGQSVFDEPNIFPGRQHETIDQDWDCSSCGYNLRGLTVGHVCPECGHIELYSPAPPGSDNYGKWLLNRNKETSASKCWLTAVVAALCGGLFAVLASLLGTGRWASLGTAALVLAVVYGPVVEETMKIAVSAYVVELRPYLFKTREQILLATAGSAAVFAIVENLIYLYVYIPNHSLKLLLWRWIVCTALHVACTTCASRGLITVWRNANILSREPRIGQAMPALVLAIVIHGCYNAAVFGIETVYGPIR